MKKDIKLIAFDIDGTLINSKGEVLDETKALIKKLKEMGIKIILCTGRTFNGHWWIREGLDLMNDDDLSIVSTGAFIRQNATGRALVNKSITKDDVAFIFDQIDDPRLQMSIHTRDIIFINEDEPNEAFLKDKGLVRMPRLKYDSLDDIPHEIARVCLSASPEILKDFEDEHRADIEKRFKYMRNAPFISEILNPKAGKSEALRDLADITDIGLDNMMYFGDGLNDLKSVGLVGVGVAMGNGAEPTRKASDYVIGTNDEPAIADFVRKYLDLDE